MGKILSLGAAIKSTVYYQSFNIKGFFFFPALLSTEQSLFLSHQPHLGGRRRFSLRSKRFLARFV